MSEPFELQVTFKPTPAAREAVEAFVMLANAPRHPELRALLAGTPWAGQRTGGDALPRELFLPHSEYATYPAPAAQALLDALRDCEPTFTLAEEKGLRLLAEGQDRGADDFCVLFLSWLASLDTGTLTAAARSGHGWKARWKGKAGQLALEKYSLPKDGGLDFSRENAGFLAGPFAFLVETFQSGLRGSVAALADSLTATSVMGHAYVDLVAQLATTNAPGAMRYVDRRLSLDLYNEQRQTLELIAGNEGGAAVLDFATTRAALLDRLAAMELLVRDEGEDDLMLQWGIADIAVAVTLRGRGLELRLRRLPFLDQFSLEEQFQLFLEQPGLAGAWHWRRLQEQAAALAAAGDTDAMCRLSHTYSVRHPGCRHDRALAEQWLVTAADRGSTAAMWTLASYYENGRGGWAHDLEKARHYLQRGAEAGHRQCQEALARLDRQPGPR